MLKPSKCIAQLLCFSMAAALLISSCDFYLSVVLTPISLSIFSESSDTGSFSVVARILKICDKTHKYTQCYIHNTLVRLQNCVAIEISGRDHVRHETSDIERIVAPA